MHLPNDRMSITLQGPIAESSGVANMESVVFHTAAVKAAQRVDKMIQGNSTKEVFCYPGTSQYQVGGVSSCGLAAMNCARIILGLEKEGLKGAELLKRAVTRDTMEEIMDICSHFASDVHLEVDRDIYDAPLFATSLRLVKTRFGAPGASEFTRSLRALQTIHDSSSAIVFTRPPEIIACIRIPLSPSQEAFVIFDSHSRHDHTDGAAFIATTSRSEAAAEISRIFPLDNSLLGDNQLQWQAQLLTNYSGHIFVSHPAAASLSPEVVNAHFESSLAMLKLKTRINELESMVELATARAGRAETQATTLRDRCKRQQETIDARRCPGCSKSTQWPPLAATGDQSRKFDKEQRKGKGMQRPVTPPPAASSSSSWSLWPSIKWGSLEAEDSVSSCTSCTTNSHMDDKESMALARRMQLEYDKENEMLVKQHSFLASNAQDVFSCEICFDDCAVDHLAGIEPCGHSFCRDCVRQHIKVALQDHRYPIYCPSCSVDSRASPSTITEQFVEVLGLDEKEFRSFQEYQLAQFSTMIHCRKCQKGVFVDKEELKASNNITCPLPNCGYVWCTKCQQDVVTGGPEHSCDGSSELNDLMQKQGWKYCPGCQTPIQKGSGCNHMQCTSPGCNMHFCYLCGGAVVQSANRSEIQKAVSRHYRKCELFQLPLGV